MKLQSKWMTWQPSDKEEKIEVPKVPQGGFGTSGTEVSVHMHLSQPPSDPVEQLHQWAMKRCVFRDRQWGSVKGLYRDYRRWSVESGSTPYAEDTFIDWLVRGCMVVDAYGLVYGLVLEEDVKGTWTQ